MKWGTFIHGDLLDYSAVENLFKNHSFDAVMHFAARSLVGESMTDPALYYQNNVVGACHLLKGMQQAGVQRLVFSSSAAIFGIPVNCPIDEKHPKHPINPYGRTKLIIEEMLQDYAKAYGLNSISLRYFNAAGADPDGVGIGESHEPETHLIPNILKVAMGVSPSLKVFGKDFETPDNTCVRDYIHVNDLCTAHLLGLEYIEKNSGAVAFNLGNGQGFSVLEVLKAAETVTGRTIAHTMVQRRLGDPPILVADNRLAEEKLGWRPQFPKINSMIASAWNWHQHQNF